MLKLVYAEKANHLMDFLATEVCFVCETVSGNN